MSRTPCRLPPPARPQPAGDTHSHECRKREGRDCQREGFPCLFLPERSHLSRFVLSLFVLRHSLFVILKSVSPAGRTDANTRTSRKKYGCSLTCSVSQANERKPVQSSCSTVPLPNKAAMPTCVRTHRHGGQQGLGRQMVCWAARGGKGAATHHAELAQHVDGLPPGVARGVALRQEAEALLAPHLGIKSQGRGVGVGRRSTPTWPPACLTT